MKTQKIQQDPHLKIFNNKKTEFFYKNGYKMKIATWNVNSVRMRLGRVEEFLNSHQPDVLCLQEIKCQTEVFPQNFFSELGYSAAVLGEKKYNGVAILSRLNMDDISVGLGDEELDAQSRVISADIDSTRVICVYIPNGADLAGDKYPFKLRWLKRLRAMLEEKYSPAQKLIICGDTNVILHDDDAANMPPWRETGIGCDEVREYFALVTQWGLDDVFRQKHPEGGVFSWWDYRHLSFPKNRGLRIDHILATSPLAASCSSCEVAREFRKGEKPSDHAPVIADFS